MDNADGERKIKKGKFGHLFVRGAVWSGVDAGIDNYRIDREERLEAACQEIGVGLKAMVLEVEGVAKLVVGGAQDLCALNRRIPMEIIKLAMDGAEGDKKSEIMWAEICETVEQEIAYEMWDVGKGAAERLWNLIYAAHKLKLRGKSADFLKRVTRCYIFGFDAECVVMCRSTLEAVFDSVISNDDCIDVLGAGNRHVEDGAPLYSLFERINVARQKRRISKETAWRAHDVRKAGKEVVHRWPKVPKRFGDSFEIVRKTLEVMQEVL